MYKFKQKKQEVNFEIKDHGVVKVSTEKPPVWDAICVAFKINPVTAIFTYGDTIYNPNNIPLNRHLVEHECVHMKQQKAMVIKKGNNVGMTEKNTLEQMTPALWWGKFLRDVNFRIDQEARAYGHQYDVICETIKDRNLRARVKQDLARSFSGPLYGNCISQAEAANLIFKFAKTRP